MSATVEGRAPRCPCGPCGWTSGGPVKIGSAYALSVPIKFVLSHLRQRRQAHQRRQHLGATCATAMVSHVVGLPLGGRVGGVLVNPLGLTPGLCLGVSGPPIGLLRVAPFDGPCRWI